MLGVIEKLVSFFSSPNVSSSSQGNLHGSCRNPGLLPDDVVRVEAAATIISRWSVPSSADNVSWEWECFPFAAARFSSNADLAEYLSAVDVLIVLQSDNSSSSSTTTGSNSYLHDRAKTVLHTAMPRLKNEFGHLMMSNSTSFAAEGSCLDSYIQRITDISLTSGGRSHNASIVSYSSSYTSSSGGGGGIPIVGLKGCLQFSSPSISFPFSRASLSLSSIDSLDEISEAKFVFNLEESVASFLQDHDSNNTILPESISSLREIADRMVRAGYHSELCELFVSLRRGILRSRLAVLGLEVINVEEAQRVKFIAVDKKVIRWILALKVVVSVVLHGEKVVCLQVFKDFDELLEPRFAAVATGFVMELLRMAKSIATLQRIPEKLFHILGLYETLMNVKPDLLDLFSGTDRQTVSREAEWVFTVLKHSVRSIFEELENLVKKSNGSVGSGEIHRLTRYIMNYMRLLVHYSTSLNFLLHDDLIEDNKIVTRFGHFIILLISCLETKLEEISQNCEHPGLQCLFLMNNISYIVQKVKNSELEGLMEEDWVQNRQDQIEQYIDNYLKVSTEKLLSYFKEGRGLRGKDLKKKFNCFNLDFEKICTIQSGWKVPDPRLREKLRMAMSNKVIPAYRSFLSKFRGYLEENTRSAAKYLKLTPEEVEGHLLDLFEG